MKLLIWGAGGHGRVILDVARRSGRFEEIAFVSDTPEGEAPDLNGCRFLGDSSFFHRARENRFSLFIVGIGDNYARARSFQVARSCSLEPVTVIDPSAVVSPSAKVGPGTVVMPQAVVNARALIGENCIINTGAVVEHDCVVEEHAHVSPRVALAGGVVVGRYTHLGIGATVLPDVRIGAHCVVGAGAVVLGAIPDAVTVVGVPARIIGTRASPGVTGASQRGPREGGQG